MSDIHALSGAYAVDALDDLERAEFERHLAGCASCRAEVASLREAAAALVAPLADDVALPAPPPELRAAVLDGITRVRPLPPVVPGGHRKEGGPVVRRRWFPALVAAVVLAVVGVGATVWQPWRDDSSGTLTAADRVLADPDAQRFTQQLPNGATATIVRSPAEHRAVLVTEDLPAAPAGKVYQLWFQTPAENMVSAGLVPDDSSTVLMSGNADDAIGAGISLEPDGGSDAPSEVVALFDFRAT
jgi:anti-sigma-K factor RskA